MRRHRLTVSSSTGVAPGIYLIAVNEGLAPGCSVEVEAVDAEAVLAAAEQKNAFDPKAAAEAAAPAIARIALRFFPA